MALRPTIGVRCVLGALAGIAATLCGPGAMPPAAGQIITTYAPFSPNPREVRCGDGVQTTRRPILHLTIGQCLAIGQNVPVLPENVTDAQRLDAFETMQRRRPVPGETVARGVTLSALPAAVTNRHPVLSRYRYFVAATDVALVDPIDRTVLALVEVRVRPRAPLPDRRARSP